MRKKAHQLFPLLCVICLLFLSSSGCEEKRKALVSAHSAVGELLVSTKDQAKTLYAQKIINDHTYNAVRINWLRAQTSYIRASDILESIIDEDMADITAYAEMITQVNMILSDIAMWLTEPPPTPTPTPTQGDINESTDNRIISDTTPATHRETRGGDTADTGIERGRQGVVKKSSSGHEGKGVAGEVGKLNCICNCCRGDGVNISGEK